jgi:hypothetical protein
MSPHDRTQNRTCVWLLAIGCRLAHRRRSPPHGGMRSPPPRPRLGGPGGSGEVAESARPSQLAGLLAMGWHQDGRTAVAALPRSRPGRGRQEPGRLPQFTARCRQVRKKLRLKRSHFGRKDRPTQSFHPYIPTGARPDVALHVEAARGDIAMRLGLASLKERRVIERRLGIERRKAERRWSGMDQQLVARPDHRAALRRHTHRRRVMNRRVAI